MCLDALHDRGWIRRIQLALHCMLMRAEHVASASGRRSVVLPLDFCKKLIRRWDSKRELSLRRHRARTTKYNRLVCMYVCMSENLYPARLKRKRHSRHKFRHRSTRLCVGTHVFTKFSEITQYNGHYAVQCHSRSPILVLIESSYTTSY